MRSNWPSDEVFAEAAVFPAVVQHVSDADHLESVSQSEPSVFVDRIPVEEGVPQQTSVGLSKSPFRGGSVGNRRAEDRMRQPQGALGEGVYIPGRVRRSKLPEPRPVDGFSPSVCAGAWPSRTAAAGLILCRSEVPFSRGRSGNRALKSGGGGARGARAVQGVGGICARFLFLQGPVQPFGLAASADGRAEWWFRPSDPL